jgi:hypothetical protein
MTPKPFTVIAIAERWECSRTEKEADDMKPIIPRLLPNGSVVIAEIPAGATVQPWRDGCIVTHPDHQPLIINADGTTEILNDLDVRSLPHSVPPRPHSDNG